AHLTAAVLQTALAVCVFIGLLIWAFGTRLARLTCAMFGAMGGLGMGIFVGAFTPSRELGVGAMVVGACRGVVLAWMFVRLWMGLRFATLLGVGAPLLVLCWQGALGGLLPSSTSSSSHARHAQSLRYDSSPFHAMHQDMFGDARTTLFI